MSDSPAYLSPANRFFSSFQIDWWQCMPEPLSPKIGFGMNVAVLPCLRETFLTMYLYHMVQSAIDLRVLNRIDSSHWPPEATSWWNTSTGMPTASMTSAISVRMSVSVSVGGTGKYPPFFAGL